MQDMVYKIKADFLKVLGHPMRLKLIEELKAGEKSVGYLVDKFKIGQPSISRHLLAPSYGPAKRVKLNTLNS